MNFTTARAIQISKLSEVDLEKVHQIEKRCGYCLPNWNIQELFNLATNKEIDDIPSGDNTAQESHRRRNEHDLQSCGINISTFGESLEKIHKTDWQIWKADINYIYQGKPGAERGVLLKKIKDKYKED